MDLVKAGKEIYGEDFKYRDHQETICSSVFQHFDVLAIQAPTGFGKTNAFLLPLLAMKKRHPNRYLNMVIVPYNPLKEDMRRRLADPGLDVGAVETIVDGSLGYLQDVYLGTSHDLGVVDLNGALERLEDRLGLLVLDEAHTILTDREYRLEVVNRVIDLTHRKFFKLVLLSATLNPGMMDELANVLKIDQGALVYENLVTAMPTHIEIEMIITNNGLQELRAAISDFMNRENGKCMVFFGQKAMLHTTARNFPTALLLDGDMSFADKIEITQKFTMGNDNLIFGTKLMSHGIDCDKVKLVIFYEFSPTQEDLIQSMGRIRKEGEVLYIGATDPGCFTRKVRRFYDLSGDGCGCCTRKRTREAAETVPEQPAPPTEWADEEDMIINYYRFSVTQVLEMMPIRNGDFCCEPNISYIKTKLATNEDPTRCNGCYLTECRDGIAQCKRAFLFQKCVLVLHTIGKLTRDEIEVTANRHQDVLSYIALIEENEYLEKYMDVLYSTWTPEGRRFPVSYDYCIQELIKVNVMDYALDFPRDERNCNNVKDALKAIRWHIKKARDTGSLRMCSTAYNAIEAKNSCFAIFFRPADRQCFKCGSTNHSRLKCNAQYWMIHLFVHTLYYNLEFRSFMKEGLPEITTRQVWMYFLSRKLDSISALEMVVTGYFHYRQERDQRLRLTSEASSLGV